MNWKIVFLLCLVVFATMAVTNITNLAAISCTSLSNVVKMNRSVFLNVDSFEPTGDPVDDIIGPT